jgi:hypothetical protein
MGIEPKRTALQSLENTAFCESPTAACDWPANFRVMRDNVGLRETTPRLLSNFRCRPRRPNASVCYRVNHSLGPNRLGDRVATATLSYYPPKEDKLRGRAHGERHRPEQSGTVDGHYSVQEK